MCGWMRIKKILNNNAVIVTDKGEEKIAVGSAIGFNKMKNDIVSAASVEKLFILAENVKFEQLLERIPEEHYIVTEEIIKYAENILGVELSNHLRVALIDHISFAIERQRDGIELRNKLRYEIEVLYKQEYDIGLWAVEHIKKSLQIEFPVDEAAFIALYIHTAKVKGVDIHETVRQTTILGDMVDTIKRQLGITFSKDDIAYDRLVTHLNFAIIRSKHNNMHTMDKDILKMIQKKYKQSYQVALEVSKKLSGTHGLDLPKEELGYIALHIERLQS